MTPSDDSVVLNVLARHRSIRQFAPVPIPQEHLDLIIDAARRAPTDATAHLYSFIRVTDSALRHRLAVLCGDQQHIRDAAEFFAVCLDVHRLGRLLARRGKPPSRWPRLAVMYGAVDAILVAQSLALSAESLGYGICFIGGILNRLDETARALQLPPGVLPVVGLCLGVPAEAPEERPRLPRWATFMENRYRELSDSELDQCYAEMRPITRSGDWLAVLERYFAAGGIMEQREAVLRRALAQQGLLEE